MSALGDRHRQAALENNLADLLRAEGRRDEAMEHLKRAVALFAEIGGQPGVPEPEIWKLVEWKGNAHQSSSPEVAGALAGSRPCRARWVALLDPSSGAQEP